ncbi:cytochrome P450 3A24-like [Halichondria panicea]|uniref:cytochrome P450 3A24-like n=1 Tax=Halichondria panicea TaxID=6063 RepID=UPI00312BC958
MALSWLLLLICFILAYIGYKLFSSLWLLQNSGIQCPLPFPIVGNNCLRYKMGYMKFHEHLKKQHGPMPGFYLGHVPFLAVTDGDMLKQIMVKEFNCFPDRPLLALTKKGSAPRGLLSARGEEWKTARHTLSPSFSAAKMKAMVPQIEKSVETLADIFREQADSAESVNVCRIFGNYTMETILMMAFGQSVDIQRGESDEIVEAARKIFLLSDERKSTFLVLVILPLMHAFPWLEFFLRFLVSQTQLAKYSKIISSVAKQLVRQRRNSPIPQKYKDLLQSMIEAIKDDQMKLTDEQIVAHSTTFLLAGYETTSNTLAYVSYLLALNPIIQEKLQQEIDNYFDNNPEAPPYEAAQEIEYLEKVIHETLRLHCPVGSILRYCQKSTVLNGVTVPKGVIVDVPVYTIHKDPRYWPNPEVFDPERFSPEEKSKRPPLSYIPFGYGQRKCLGMRFALLEAKLALIHLLRRFTFTQTPDTEVPLQVSIGMSVAPKNGIFLKIKRREHH